jgi:hypothetical protein
MNKFSFHISLLIGISLTACSKTHYQFETIPQKPTVVYAKDSLQAKDVEIDVNYVSSDLELSVFQVDVFNGSEDTIYFFNKEVNLSLKTDYYREGAYLYPLEKDFLINEYNYQQKQLQLQKKRNTFWNIFTAGITLASIVTSSGAVTVNSVGFAAESTAYILEDRSYYNALTGSIEDRILYIEDWVLDEVKIAPGEKDAFDLLFEHIISDGECSLELNFADNLYIFPYLLQTRKIEK